jgi:hypothetical protein
MFGLVARDVFNHRQQRAARGGHIDRIDAAHRDLAIARDLYTASRAYIRAIVTSLPAAAWQQAAVHSVVGKLTVEQQVAKILWHDDHHRPQAEAALAGRIWTPAPA